MSMHIRAGWSRHSLLVDINYNIHWFCKQEIKAQISLHKCAGWYVRRLIWACIVSKLHKGPLRALHIICEHQIGHNGRKCSFWHEHLKIQISLHICSLICLHCPYERTLPSWLSKMCSVKILISLHKCTGWSESSLGKHVHRDVFYVLAQIVVRLQICTKWTRSLLCYDILCERFISVSISEMSAVFCTERPFSNLRVFAIFFIEILICISANSVDPDQMLCTDWSATWLYISPENTFLHNMTHTMMIMICFTLLWALFNPCPAEPGYTLPL